MFNDKIYATQNNNTSNAILMFESFICSKYAEILDKENEKERLFNLGIAAGRDFVVKARSGKIEDEEAEKIYFSILFRLSGPTVDFVIGRIYESASEIAKYRINSCGSKINIDLFKRENKCTEENILLDSQELKKVWAERLYNDSNCSLLK